jgi:quercetin dioxygenase-like cupin family protein
VITLLSGRARLLVEGRRYEVNQYDAMHIPAGVPHAVHNDATGSSLFHSAFASAAPAREIVESAFLIVDLADTTSRPEHPTRFRDAQVYELAPHARFRDLFAARFGSRGICGGYGLFEPGASLPCHYHDYDESITIVEGHAICQVAGSEYPLTDNDTACVPRGRPHRFINRSSRPMAMLWVYAGGEPDRVIVDQCLCEGSSLAARGERP